MLPSKIVCLVCGGLVTVICIKFANSIRMELSSMDFDRNSLPWLFNSSQVHSTNNRGVLAPGFSHFYIMDVIDSVGTDVPGV